MGIERKRKGCRYILCLLSNLLLILLSCFWCSWSPALAAPVKDTVGFVDINSHWAQKDISRLYALELVKGYPDHTFKPDQLVSRLETAVLIVRSGGFTAEAEKAAAKTNNKNDKKSTSSTAAKQIPRVPWGQSYIDLAVRKGFLTPDSPGDYDFDGPATRLEVAELLARAMYLVPPVTGADSAMAEIKSVADAVYAKTFSDLDALKPAEKTFIAAVAYADVMSGYPDGTFRPRESLTRAEMAVILSRLVDRGWVKLPAGRHLAGWISAVDDNKGSKEITLISLSGAQKLKAAGNVQCYRVAEKCTLADSVNFQCEAILDGQKQVSWINLLEQRDDSGQTDKIRGSVKMVVLGEDNYIIVNNMYAEDLFLPLAWDAVLTGNKATKGFNSLKLGNFVDVEVSKGKVRKATLLDVKTTSGKVDRIENGCLYLEGDSSGKKPIWFNHYDYARLVNKEGTRQVQLQAGSPVSITYLDPLPNEIDDEVALEIKVTK
ncbi:MULTISPECIES: S-layer homology domain-containing protein [Pelotomaculum]|uniref:S-layer homology domain-containing protein n=1 Tax=Pelotomaculum isophthalicicum JI TaxID=947010 RepID=A0A9X4H7Q1_9FIRM|nr:MULTISPECIES: S-layer homology domain-containing protein [Pelotomaculum]MDF9409869.1 S-layer homology domain-containing protein [Pelotomaculum isophthalicicum JI]OPX89027.1 MAG: Cellulosome-anchoring protein precursor [Pelotomaculum sp. PtaB.Bin117]